MKSVGLKLKNKRILILGYGREGKSAFKFLRRRLPKAKIGIADRKYGKDYLDKQKNYDIVVKSPGIPEKFLKIPYTTPTNIFFENLPKGVTTIGVTGSKGKSTVSTLVHKILKKAGRDVFLAGNIGKPALNILPKLKKNSIAVLELSSFHLRDLRLPVSIACVLNIFPEHLDRHKNFKEYADAKLNIAKYQRPGDRIFFFKEGLPKKSYETIDRSPAKKFSVDIGNFDLFPQSGLKIKGIHNFKNAAMAAKIAENFGVVPEIIKKTILNFKGLEHRLEFVKKINGAEFYNDSASTNPQAAIAAIKAFFEPKIFVAGGKDKNLDYRPLAAYLKNSNIKKIILFGENKEKIKKAIIEESQDCVLCEDLETAVGESCKAAKDGDVVLFSPASASFDMFKDYSERGRVFKRTVNQLRILAT